MRCFPQADLLIHCRSRMGLESESHANCYSIGSGRRGATTRGENTIRWWNLYVRSGTSRVYMCTRDTCLCACLSVHTWTNQSMPTWRHVLMSLIPPMCTCTCVHVCTSVRVDVHMHASMCNAQGPVCLCIHKHVCAHMYASAYTLC